LNLKKIIKKIIAIIFYHCYYRYVKPTGNRVLIYHAFGSKLEHDSYGISINPILFEKHLIYLKDNYTLLPLNNDTLDNKLNIDSVSITIDDGYKDNLVAIKLLEKYNIPYTIYISTGFIGKDQYLSSEDIKNISKSPLCTLGTHTINHIPLVNLSKEEQYKELYESKIKLESIIDKEIKDFSYPHGIYDNTSKKIADKLYEVISTSHIGINSIAQDKKMIKRIEVIASDDVNKLHEKIIGYFDYLG
jgi:peptidoglycan/xylan/chitin deacetylase (PgdA/CDA1 family)